MSFECAHCHEYVAGVGIDPPQFCDAHRGESPTCKTCGKPFVWGQPIHCVCQYVHGEWPRDVAESP